MFLWNKIFSRQSTTTKYQMRFLVADVEYQIGWADQHSQPENYENLYWSLKYLMKEIGGCFNIRNLRLTDTRGQRKTLKEIAQQKVPVIFVISDNVKGKYSFLGNLIF
jgi:hypothetical protein